MNTIQSSKLVYIYALVDPRDGLIRYVGKAISPLNRFNHHLNDSKNGTFAVHNWIRSMENEGLKPYYVILEKVKAAEWATAEQKWIEFYRSQNGHKFMLNMTNGGDCGPSKSGESNYWARLTDLQVRTMREERVNGATASELSAKYGVLNSTVMKLCHGDYRRSAGGPIEPKTRVNRRRTNEEKQEILALFATGRYSHYALSKLYKATPTTIRKICNSQIREWRTGELNPSSKLTTNQVLDIRRQYATGNLTQVTLAAKYNVSQAVISAIILRKIWAHI